MPKVSMTDLWLNKVTNPSEKPIEYRDIKEPALAARVGKSGQCTFYVLHWLTVEKKLRRKRLGKYPGMSLKQARNEASEIATLGMAGVSQPSKLDRLIASPTVKEICDVYIEHHLPKLAANSQDADNRKIKNIIVPRWGDRKAIEIKRLDVIKLMDELVKKTPTTANRTLGLIRSIFKIARGRDLLDTDPCLDVVKPYKEVARDRFLSDDEIPVIWSIFEDEMTLQMGSIMKLLLTTAQREVEVYSMRWDQIDFTTNWWTIPKEVAKNKKSHRVPLSKLALEIIESQRAKSGHTDWVFSSAKNKSGHISNVNKSWRTSLTDEDGDRLIDDITTHDLRRTAATGMGALQVTEYDIKKVLNHSNGSVTGIYNRHTYDEEKRVALDKWAEHLSAVLKRANKQ